VADDRAEILAGLRARSGTPRPPTRRTVWFQARGPDVDALQHRLAAHGVYSLDDGDEPGLFGAATEQALRAFQRAHELRPDAICGPVTWRALDAQA
jgi:peptidoglycan hydrolase-like protein with peptidoglycan-binding domain